MCFSDSKQYILLLSASSTLLLFGEYFMLCSDIFSVTMSILQGSTVCMWKHNHPLLLAPEMEIFCLHRAPNFHRKLACNFNCLYHQDASPETIYSSICNRRGLVKYSGCYTAPASTTVSITLVVVYSRHKQQ